MSDIIAPPKELISIPKGVLKLAEGRELEITDSPQYPAIVHIRDKDGREESHFWLPGNKYDGHSIECSK